MGLSGSRKLRLLVARDIVPGGPELSGTGTILGSRVCLDFASDCVRCFVLSASKLVSFVPDVPVGSRAVVRDVRDSNRFVVRDVRDVRDVRGGHCGLQILAWVDGWLV